MKGFAAAIILFILCFNWFGYSAVVFFMQQKADLQLEASLDTKSIKESELFEIKIALHLPYQTNWANYERYDGEVKLDGTIYKYVKRKVTADTLHLMCIRNTKKMEYENAKSDFYKGTNDLTSKNNPKKAPSITIKKMVVDADNVLFDLSSKQIILEENNYFPSKARSTSDAHLISPKQPPEGALA